LAPFFITIIIIFIFYLSLASFRPTRSEKETHRRISLSCSPAAAIICLSKKIRMDNKRVFNKRVFKRLQQLDFPGPYL